MLATRATTRLGPSAEIIDFHCILITRPLAQRLPAVLAIRRPVVHQCIYRGRSCYDWGSRRTRQFPKAVQRGLGAMRMRMRRRRRNLGARLRLRLWVYGETGHHLDLLLVVLVCDMLLLGRVQHVQGAFWRRGLA